MIAKNEGNEGYRISGGRLTLDGTPVHVHPRALLDAIGAHFAEDRVRRLKINNE